MELTKLMLKFIWKNKHTKKKPEKSLKKEKVQRAITQLDFKTYYKVL